MVIAALICFGILLVAWILAPTDAPRPAVSAEAGPTELAALPEAA
jgi:hypothetical protein